MKDMSVPMRIGVVVAVLLLGAGYFFLTKSDGGLPAAVSSEIPEGAVVVTLTENGFSPDTLTVTKGQTVAFRTTGKDLYWPASNLHPSHTIYPEFDPLEPVQPNAVWSFTFEKAGEWKYHDHLAPYFTGVITVTE